MEINSFNILDWHWSSSISFKFNEIATFPLNMNESFNFKGIPSHNNESHELILFSWTPINVSVLFQYIGLPI